MKKTSLSLSFAVFSVAGSQAGAALISHYTFDVDNAGSTPDLIGAASATLGDRVQINTTEPGRIGGGVLEMLGSGDSTGPADGAVSTNSFSWANDARTVTFWWKAKTPNVNANDGTFVSFGDLSANGTRFDIKEQGASNTELRVEVQGHGSNSNPGIDDGSWQFIAVTVPNGATFADISWYTNGSTSDLNTSNNSLDIATGTSPLAFGDSILTAGTNDRVPSGYLDDFQLYDEVLDQTQISFLFNNPGSVIPEPSVMTLFGLCGFALLCRRRS